MIQLDVAGIDWIFIRQALSLSLASGKDICLKGAGTVLEENYFLGNIYSDLTRLCREASLGEIALKGNDIISRPQRAPFGIYTVQTGPASSAVELFLFLMPALFTGEFRSVVRAFGVTHSPVSYPTSFLKEALFPALEGLGLYGALHLKRFGFSGMGGGVFEGRIYPAEGGADTVLVREDMKAPRGVVYLGRADVSLGKEVKKVLVENSSLKEGDVAIIEVQDTDGYGLSVQISSGAGKVWFRDFSFYGSDGEFAFDYDDVTDSLKDLCRDAEEGRGDPFLERELAVYRGLYGDLTGHKKDDVDIKTAYLIDELF